MSKRKITVRLTVAEWNALRSCATGELEGMSEADLEADYARDLGRAIRAMVAARRKAAAS